MRRRVLGVLALATVLVARPQASIGASMPIALADPVLWRWLPHGEDMWEPQRRGLTAYAALSEAEMFWIPAGRTTGSDQSGRNVVYDPLRHVVLYWNGCCDWEETVLAAVTGVPPRHVHFGDLGAVRTPRGVGLGASPSAVLRAYGPARPHRSTTTPALRVLSYYRDMHVPQSSCGRYEHFVFTKNRLTEIHAGHSC
jgi:hypothetical protein